jgi:hypothetical protein
MTMIEFDSDLEDLSLSVLIHSLIRIPTQSSLVDVLAKVAERSLYICLPGTL